jgi:hypothetical protein
MGFNSQPNLWQCGPYALKHALIMLGIVVDEKKITRAAGVDASGSDEADLARAARQFGCNLKEVRKTDPGEARGDLVDYLRRRIPCLICVNQWKHWVVIVKEERGKFILLNSEVAAVLSILNWDELRKIWAYHPDTRPRTRQRRISKETLFDLYPLVPNFRVQIKARFSIARAQFLRRPENRAFAQQWDEYLSDLLKLCKPRTPLSENVISLGEFLRRHGEMILDEIAYWHGKIERKAAEKVLRNMRFVADTHGLVVHRDDEKRAIAGLTSVLTLWASSTYGVGPVYQGRKRNASR